ncbi:MAG TPA: DNA repair protein RecO [Syntrophobacteria bacterium]|nr:DNA repair protein RecO [Syntrophobacteria bacterium]
MWTRRSNAVILRTRDYGESDRLVTFLSHAQGKLTGIAKGARRSKRRFVHTLEPLSLVHLTYVERAPSSLVRIDASELTNPFTALRQDLTRVGYASVGVELVLELAPEREANPSLFALLAQYLERLEAGGDPENLALLFQTRILSLSGFGPNLQRCARCSVEPTGPGAWFFSTSRGTLLCPAHQSGGEASQLSPGTILLLRQAQRLPLEKLWRLRSHRQSRAECRTLLLGLIRHHLEKDLKSLTVLQQIGAQ